MYDVRCHPHFSWTPGCKGLEMRISEHVNIFTLLAIFSVNGSPSLASESSNNMSEFDSSTTCETKKQIRPELKSNATDERD